MNVHVPVNQEAQRYPHYNAQYYAVNTHAHPTGVIERMNFDFACDPRNETANEQQQELITNQNVKPGGNIF